MPTNFNAHLLDSLDKYKCNLLLICSASDGMLVITEILSINNRYENHRLNNKNTP